MFTKYPPLEKVYEAWSAVADGRVEIVDEFVAHVTSSDGSKTYTVVYNPENATWYSDDNATFWQGYAGYPIIAVMMERGLLPVDRAEAARWSGVNWTATNAAHKRDYAGAAREVARSKGIDPAEARARALEVEEALRRVTFAVKRLTPALKRSLAGQLT